MPGRWHLLVLGAALTLAVRGAHAEPDEARPIEPVPPAPGPVTAETIADAPLPQNAARYEAPPEERPPGRAPARAALMVPRILIKGALAPVRLALWTEDRYQVSARARDLFWSDDRTIGVVPVGSWQGGRSLSGGLAFTDRDLAGGTADLRATVGTSERLALGASFGTGRLLHRWRLEAGAGYRDVTDASFYGYGDAEDADEMVTLPVDPTADLIAIDSRFRERETTVRAGAVFGLPGAVWLSVGGSLRWIEFGRPHVLFGDDPIPIDEAYDVGALPGYEAGVEAARGEVGLHIDRLRTRHRLQSRAVPSIGFAAQLYAGWQEGFGGDPTRFAYGGLDVLHYVDIYGGDRVLSLRLTVDAALADLEQIPFVELPTLGGGYLLRGYETGRFRDRWAGTASLEYSWPVTEGLASFLFVDVGRVARGADELLADGPRSSGGIGLQLHDKTSLLARAWVAVTADGGVMTSLKLEPFFGRRPREKVE